MPALLRTGAGKLKDFAGMAERPAPCGFRYIFAVLQVVGAKKEYMQKNCNFLCKKVYFFVWVCYTISAFIEMSKNIENVKVGRQAQPAIERRVPLDIADKEIGNLDYRLLWFTKEDKAETARVIRRFETGESAPYPHTGGLYYRKLL